uniref:Uncharacterized protein n=1 Tax=Thermogladius calderae TaxID=1200300 RepID=A0A7J3XX03_9CREN
MHRTALAGLAVVLALLVAFSAYYYVSLNNPRVKTTTTTSTAGTCSPASTTISVTSTTLQFPTTTPTPTTTTIQLGEGWFISRVCPVGNTSVEMKVSAGLITDEQLLNKTVSALENLVNQSVWGLGEDTLRLISVLKHRGGNVALLKITVEIRNNGDSPIPVYGGACEGPSVLDFVLENLTGRREIGFSNTWLTPINGTVYTGDGIVCVLALYIRYLFPGQSMENIRYFVIEKPSPDGVFKARVDVLVKGLSENLCLHPQPQEPCNCTATFFVTY